MGKVDISGLIAIQLDRHVRIRVSDSVYGQVRERVYAQIVFGKWREN